MSRKFSRYSLEFIANGLPQAFELLTGTALFKPVTGRSRAEQDEHLNRMLELSQSHRFLASWPDQTKRQASFANEGDASCCD